MIKPHEEEWGTGEGSLSGALYTKDGTWIGSFTGADRARLAAHAPDLAQRLLANGGLDSQGQWHNDSCLEYGHGPGCEKDRAALKAAGVIHE
jgi:hypothetical protein